MPHAERTESVTFRVDPALKAALTGLADRNRTSMGELLRDIASERVQREQRKTFVAAAHQQAAAAAAAARNPSTDEHAVMQELDADLTAFGETWK